MLAQRVPVLMYHRVGSVRNAAERTYCIAPERFAGHMRMLDRAGYRAVPIEEFSAWLAGQAVLPEGAFVLTFDDGFLGVHEHAAPVLKELGWPATVFLVSALTGQHDAWHERERATGGHALLDRPHIAAMRDGGFSFHSHSRRHADLTTLTDAELDDELAGSRKELAELLGSAPDFIAYPYGRFDDRVVESAHRAGYRAAFSVLSGFNRPGGDPFRIRRLDVFGTDTPTMLLRKIRLGSNDGSWHAGLRYAAGRLKQRMRPSA